MKGIQYCSPVALIRELRNVAGEYVFCRSASGQLLQLFGVTGALYPDL
jgi:hypothetical protein